MFVSVIVDDGDDVNDDGDGDDEDDILKQALFRTPMKSSMPMIAKIWIANKINNPTCMEMSKVVGGEVGRRVGRFRDSNILNKVSRLKKTSSLRRNYT